MPDDRNRSGACGKADPVIRIEKPEDRPAIVGGKLIPAEKIRNQVQQIAETVNQLKKGN